MKVLYRVIVIALALSLGGCGWLFGERGMFRDRSDDYRDARLLEPLQVPSELSEGAIDDGYPVPEITEEVVLSGDFEVPRPDPLEGDPGSQLVRIQRLGEEQWILVDISPGQVWPQVRAFLNRAQLGTGRTDPDLGVIETSWLEPADESLARERYRFRIEQGVQRGTSEIYVLQDSIGGEQWPADSDNPEREDAMVQELSQFVANSAAQGAVSMVAERALDSRGKVFLRRDAGESYLDLRLPFARAWASLGLALEKAEFEVEDLDRSQREYWVKALPRQREQRECGWFSWLFGCREDTDDNVTGRSYAVVVEPAEDEAVRIRIRARDGEPLSDEQVSALLKRIKGYIN